MFVLTVLVCWLLFDWLTCWLSFAGLLFCCYSWFFRFELSAFSMGVFSVSGDFGCCFLN